MENNGLSVDWNRIDVFYGDFYDSKYENGIFFSLNQNKDQLYVYKGKFKYNTGLGRLVKQDDNCLFYSSKECRLFEGVISADILKNGKVYLMDKLCKGINRIYECEFNEDEKNLNTIKNYTSVKDVLYKDNLKKFVNNCDSILMKQIEKLKKLINEVFIIKSSNDLTNITKRIESVFTENYRFESLKTLYSSIIDKN